MGPDPILTPLMPINAINHADRDALLEFAQHALPRAKTIFTALGEPTTERFLAQRIHDFLGGHAVVSHSGETWEISKESVKKVS